MAVDQAWTVAEAKARLSELLHEVTERGPQVITRRGREIAVVVEVDEWHRKTRRTDSLAEFFAGSPLVDSGLAVSRDTDRPREVSL